MRLEEELKRFKSLSESHMQSSEAEEEAITNRLLQKLRSAQEECESAKAQRRHGNPASSDSDRDTLAIELKHAVAKYEALRAQQSHILSKFEEEEEAVTNLMHKRIETVEQEKLQLKKRLHEMQRRIARLQNEKTALEHKVERGEEAHAILMKDRVKLFVDMESEQENMTLRTIRSNSFGSVGGGAPVANDRTAAIGGAGFGRSPGYAVSSANSRPGSASSQSSLTSQPMSTPRE